MISNMNRLILYGLILPLISFPVKSSPGIKVKAVPPVYSVEIKDVTLYEATIPLFFHVHLPKLPDQFHDETHPHRICDTHKEVNSSTGFNKYHCGLEQQFALASKHIVEDLKELQRLDLDSKINHGNDNLQRKIPKRKRRQLVPIIAATSFVAGFFLRPAITKFTGNLFGSDDDWKDHYNTLRESLLKDHELLVEFEHSTDAYTQQMSDIISTISGLLSEQRHDLLWTLRLLSTKIHADMVQSAIQSCKSRHLPNLIKPAFLENILTSLNRNLSESLNYTLAIGPEQLGKYYKLPIVDCLITPETAHITMNIPLIRTGSEWKLYEIVHPKFSFHNQTCDMYPIETSYLAQHTNSKSVLITNHILKYCSIYEDKLCMIPQYGKDPVQSLQCTALANFHEFTLSEIQNLVKSCSFRCYPTREVVITQIDETKVVITNAKSLYYKCESGHERLIQLGSIGAVEVNLKCGCKVVVDGNEILENILSCSRNLDKDLVTFAIPFAWAHDLKRITGENDTFVDNHEELGNHVNHDWPSLIPVLNFTKEHKNEAEEFIVPEKVEYASIILTVEVWLAILTVVMVVHVCITFYCCFKLFFASITHKRPEEGWFRRGSDERSPRRRPNRNSGSSESGVSIRSNRKRNLDIYREVTGRGGNKNLPSTATDFTTVSLAGPENQDDSYHSNRNSVVNKLI